MRLGVKPTASIDEIKSAYRALVMKHHPDKGGDAEAFRQITGAYETLSDPQKKAAHDRDNLRSASSARIGSNVRPSS
jgi:DnaJ-class molecular chaperone